MRIGILTAIWGRPRLTEAMLDYYARLEVPGIDFVRMSVVSPGDPDPCKLNPAWRYAGADNMPLTDKWNAGAKLVADLDVDCVVITGSDDFLNAAYFEHVRDLILEGADYIKLGGLHFYDFHRLIYVKDCFAGLGRCLSRRLMDMVEWEPYAVGHPKGIDGRMDERCFPLVRDTTARIRDSRSKGIFAVDVKNGTNIHSFEAILEKYGSEVVECDPREMLLYLQGYGDTKARRSGFPAAESAQRYSYGGSDEAHRPRYLTDVRRSEVSR